jgi:hypothetical protein
LEFLKASIANLIRLLLSSLKNSEGSGDGDSGDSCADRPPPHFIIFEGQNNLLPLAKTKIIARINV